MNLVSPRIDYGGYNKRIDLTPFVDTIANTTYRIASESAIGSGTDNKPVTGIGTLLEILTERNSVITGNEELMRKCGWTQSTPYYFTRKRLKDKNGPEVSRKYITGKIKEVCLKEFNKTREELGIFAADRAQMYFRGQWYDVGFEEISELKKMGTDLLVIEKENVAGVLGTFGDEYGIALLNSRGFLVDYAVKLSELSGGNIAILTDFDDSGLLMAKKVPRIPRIGIDNETLRYFHLRREDLEEPYDEDHRPNHYMKLEELAKTDRKLKAMLAYVKDSRVEIDSALAAVGNEKFWRFVMKKLGEFPTRNYNRAIEIPKDVIPKEFEDFLKGIKNKSNSAAKDQRDEIEAQLEEVKGFIVDIGDKEEGIKEQIREVVSENEDIKALVIDIQKLVDKYPFLKENSTGGI